MSNQKQLEILNYVLTKNGKTLLKEYDLDVENKERENITKELKDITDEKFNYETMRLDVLNDTNQSYKIYKDKINKICEKDNTKILFINSYTIDTEKETLLKNIAEKENIYLINDNESLDRVVNSLLNKNKEFNILNFSGRALDYENVYANFLKEDDLKKIFKLKEKEKEPDLEKDR